MNLRRLNIETTLYVLALLLALGLRFYQLGASPLTDAEAHWALQAWQVANPGASGAPLEIGPQPAYVFLTERLLPGVGDLVQQVVDWVFGQSPLAPAP